MKTISVNEDAMRDVLLTVMNPEALEGLMVAYRLVDAAERRGMAEGYGNGADAGYKHGYEQGSTVGYEEGVHDTEAATDVDEEETFRNGWYFGHAAGVKETPRPMIYIAGPNQGEYPPCDEYPG